jgi:hypothetical protein
MLWWSLSLSASAIVIMAHGGSNVTYDSRSLVINGKHKIIFSGSIHYPRSTPQVLLFPSLLCISCFNLLIIFVVEDDVTESWPFVKHNLN